MGPFKLCFFMFLSTFFVGCDNALVAYGTATGVPMKICDRARDMGQIPLIPDRDTAYSYGNCVRMASFIETGNVDKCVIGSAKAYGALGSIIAPAYCYQLNEIAKTIPRQ